MLKSLGSILAGNLALFALALMASCSCLCGDKIPAIGSAPFRRPGQDPNGKGEVWRFVASGDSRNCGDVVMPAIAAGAKLDGAQFYWHLGDLRAIYDFDNDMLQEAKLANKHLTIVDYENNAWDDFYKNQVVPFENIPFYLGIGNHETIPPKTRCEFVNRFETLLDKAELQGGKAVPAQTPKSHAKPSPSAQNPIDCKKSPDAFPCCRNNCQECDRLRSKTYYQWVKNGVDFIYLDNASNDQFDDDQMRWFDGVMKADADNKQLQTIVVGMHKALPWSVSCDHSMNESPQGIASGVKVYEALLDLQKKDKKIYLLASHSHYYLQDIFNTRHWNNRVLPGWIVGTAGAERYVLPRQADRAKARANVYGYLLGRVYADGRIAFEFTELKPSDVPGETQSHYSERFVKESCFAGNISSREPEERDYCKETP